MTHKTFWAGAAALVIASGTLERVPYIASVPYLASLTSRAAAQTANAGISIDKAIVDAFKWRSIGPSRGGRSIAVSGVKGRPKEGYFGAVGGGLWKTTDGGLSWNPITDGQIHSSSVGAVAVSESNPDIIYIGMGESCIRGNIMAGDGVYKSNDAGKTWTHVGFSDSEAISKIRIHPTNPDIAFVADFGRYGKDSDERGVFKTVDGGKTWKKVLFKNGKTGAADVEIDRKNPNVVFAAMWGEVYRVEYQMSSGGPGSGLYKSTDGGETWKELTHTGGLPSGLYGKISIALTAADSNRVYALIENDKGGLYSSDDAGTTWKMVNEARSVRQRAFYYTHAFADPTNKDVVYMLNTSAFRSTDGGKNLVQIGQGTHGDNHDLWIDSDDPNHVILGNDGGGAVSFDIASQRHWTGEGFPTEQFYHVITTKHVPYHVCGAQQDNSTLCVPSNNGQGRGGGGAGPQPENFYTVGGNEDGYIAPDPKNLDVFYSGSNNGSFITRLDRRTGDLREVNPYPRFFSGENSASVVERWQWTFPIAFSPVDPSVLYTSSQHVWKTTNEGLTWTRISDDLTRHDPKTMQDSGGPITHDMNSPEIYATVFALAPGKTDANVIWAADDGVVHVTRDAGKTWTNITPKDMPDLGRVSIIDASTFEPGTAYMAVKKPLLEDFSPYLYRTHDFGRTWTKIVNGIAPNDFTHAIREDPARRGLLYAGTQHGFYVSLDDGDHWQALANGLADTQVSDIWVEANDIAIATHGRGFYILDDVNPIRQLGAAPSSADVSLFKPGDAIRGGGPARITYQLKKPAQKLTLEILDSRGQVLRTVDGAAPSADGRASTGAGQAAGSGGRGRGEVPTPTGSVEDEEGGGRGRGGPPPSMFAGVQRYNWDLQTQPVVTFPGMVLWGASQNGPMVLPGTYQVRLTVDGAAFTQSIVVKKNPLKNVSDADLQAQYDLAIQIRDKVNEANTAIVQIRRIKKDLAERVEKANNADARAIAELLQKELTAVEEDVYQVRNQSNQDPLNFPIRTNNRLASLLRVVTSGEGRPTGNTGPIFEDLKKELQGETDRLQKTLTTYLPRFNQVVTRLGLQPISEK